MDSLFVNSLLEDLKNSDEKVREEATKNFGASGINKREFMAWK